MNNEEFKKYMHDYLTHLTVERNMAEHTLRAYESDLNQFIEFWDLHNIQNKVNFPFKQTVERFLVAMYHKKIKKSSIARKISCLKSFAHYIEVTKGIEINLNIARPRLDKKLPIYLSIDEVFHLLDTIQDADLPTSHPLRDKAILELLYATGIRCSELVSIRLESINLEDKTIIIFGKGKKERVALFGQKAKDRITHYLTHERPPAKDKQEFLFLNYRNESLTTRSIQRILEMFRQFLKIERPITPHKIRHSFATHLLNQGADLRVVQELLGHKSLSSTQKYTHVTTAQLMQLCDTIHPYNKFNKKKTEETP